MSIHSNFEDQIQVVDAIEKRDMTIEIIEFKQLKGSQSPLTAMQMMFAQQSGMKLRQVRVKLRGGSLKTEAGALYFSKGNISCETQIGGIGGAIGKMFKSTITSESTFKPVYTGEGEIYLEPTFNHFIMLEIEDDSIIVDKGYFYCCSGNMKVEPYIQNNVSSAFLGGEGFVQTQIIGTGIVVLEIPVPQEEILKYDLVNDRVQVDGNFTILRTDGIKFTVQKSSKSLIGSLMNGEGLLQTFEGTGQVWLAPTASVYRKIEFGSYGLVNATNNSLNNKQ